MNVSVGLHFCENTILRYELAIMAMTCSFESIGKTLPM